MTPHLSLQPDSSQDRPNSACSTGSLGLAVSSIVGILYAYWLLPDGFITGTHSYWLAQNEDITVYVSGFYAFFREAWHWPLWRIDSLNWPEGTLTTFLDAIPLFAALLKLAAPASWFPFNPYGLWVALCLALQSIGAWWVLREARIQSWMALLTLTFLLLMFPAWLARMGHISLMSQWVIVFALALTVRSTRQQRFPGPSWCVLLWLAFFTNIYLFSMSALIFACDAIYCLRKGNLRAVLLWSPITVTLIAVSAFVTMWPIPGSTGAPDVGFGIYSMNVLSPFTGSRFFEPTAHSAEQAFEGYNYLGLGGLTLVATALWLRLRHAPRIRAWIFPFELWAALILCTLYALSNVVYAGQTLLWTWQVPEWAKPLTGQLRASGRFFWVVGYTIIIFSIITICRRVPRKTAGVLMTAVLLLQTIDLWPQLQKLRHLQPNHSGAVIDYREWDTAIPIGTKTVYFFPKLKCNRKTSHLNTLLPVMRYSSERDLNITTGYIARHNPICAQESVEIAQSDSATSTYVFVNQEYSPAQIRGFFPNSWIIACRVQDFATLCQRLP